MTTASKSDWLRRLFQRKWLFLLPLIGALAGAGLFLVAPKKYESIARLQRHQSSNESARYFALNFSRAFPTTYLSSKQLKELVQQEELTQRWQHEEAEIVSHLKNQITIEEEPTSNQYTVHFLHSDPEEAQAILQTLIELHLTRRAREEMRRAEKQIEALQDEIDNQQTKIQQSENKEEARSHRALLEELKERNLAEREALKAPPEIESIIQPASLPKLPVIPNLYLNLTVGFLTGTLIALLLLKERGRPACAA